VVNCNLQRLDGRRGNGKIIRVGKAHFDGRWLGSVKSFGVVMGSIYLARDHSGKLLDINEYYTVDGRVSKINKLKRRLHPENFFGKFPENQRHVANMSDDDHLALKSWWS